MPRQRLKTLPVATFVLSLDFELAWGMRDLLGDHAQREECRVTREVVVPRLLEMFERYGLPASWCTVGQLFDESISHPASEHFAQFEAPNHGWCDDAWYQGVPSGTEAEIPDYLCPSLIKKILRAQPPQEIGSHGFSHAIFGDAGCTPACARSEMRASVERAQKMGVELRSMVFPRNEVGHLEVLREHGFLCYRGLEASRWAERGNLKKASHVLSILAQRFAYPVMPEKDAYGLWNIPASMMFFPAHGVRKYVPMSFRTRRAMRGIDAAVRSRQAFHLWFHPINLAIETQGLMRSLEDILRHAARLRDEGKLRMMSMGELAQECEDRTTTKSDASSRRTQGDCAS